MKIFSILIVIIIFSFGAFAQNFSAQYLVKRKVSAMVDGRSMLLDEVELSGEFYWSGNRVISFNRPLYLEKYPDGSITYEKSRYEHFGTNLPTAKKQFVKYIALDSNLIRSTILTAGMGTDVYNEVSEYDTLYRKWTIYPETKMIDGLLCTRATSKSGGVIYFDGWFATEIPMLMGIMGLINPPGLLVEGEYFGINSTYKLKQYSFDKEIDPAVFWPEEFNWPFKVREKMFFKPRPKPPVSSNNTN